MVPLHHSTAYGLQAMFEWTNRYRDVAVPNFDQLGTLPYYVLMFARQFDAFGVPAFLFVSGFFIAFMVPVVEVVSRTASHRRGGTMNSWICWQTRDTSKGSGARLSAAQTGGHGSMTRHRCVGDLVCQTRQRNTSVGG